MTLYDFMNGATIQGNIRLSRWADGRLLDDFYLENVDDLAVEQKARDWEERDVLYIFANNGVLNIELEA
jgi:hypothetical protein